MVVPTLWILKIKRTNNNNFNLIDIFMMSAAHALILNFRHLQYVPFLRFIVAPSITIINITHHNRPSCLKIEACTTNVNQQQHFENNINTLQYIFDSNAHITYAAMMIKLLKYHLIAMFYYMFTMSSIH